MSWCARTVALSAESKDRLGVLEGSFPPSTGVAHVGSLVCFYFAWLVGGSGRTNDSEGPVGVAANQRLPRSEHVRTGTAARGSDGHKAEPAPERDWRMSGLALGVDRRWTGQCPAWMPSA